jgi:hypothetical protein
MQPIVRNVPLASSSGDDVRTGERVSAPPTPQPRRSPWRAPAILLLGVLIVSVLGYLAWSVPGAWFPNASAKTWYAQDLTLARGTGALRDRALVVTATDANGVAVISVNTDLRATDYPGVAWVVANLQEDAVVKMLWSTDVRPDKVNSIVLGVQSGRTLPIVMAENRDWVGRITGLALVIEGRLAQPVLIGGVTAKPMGVPGLIRDRLHDWFSFEPWNGASINTITGGADNQPIPLPAALALVLGVASAIAFALRRAKPRAFAIAMPAMLAAFFVAGWLILDSRWTLNLVRQEHATALRFAGKDEVAKHLASEDGALFAFIEKAEAVMPKTPVRVFVAADDDYVRGRAAYHLYPHSVYFSPRGNTLPPPSAMRAGDWVLVFERHGIAYDKALGKLRWDGQPPIDAELKMVAPGGALFVIR